MVICQKSRSLLYCLEEEVNYHILYQLKAGEWEGKLSYRKKRIFI